MKYVIVFFILIYLYLSATFFILGYGDVEVIYGRRKVTSCSNVKELNNFYWAHKLGCILGDGLQ